MWTKTRKVEFLSFVLGILISLWMKMFYDLYNVDTTLLI